MGADGGVCWVAVKSAKDAKRLCELLPSSMLLVDDFSDRPTDAQRPEYDVFSTYGSFQPFSIRDLGCLVDEEPDVLELFGPTVRLCDIPVLTHVIESEGTRWWGMLKLEELLYTNPGEINYFLPSEDVMSMLVVDWYAEIKQIVGKKPHVFWIETWT